MPSAVTDRGGTSDGSHRRAARASARFASNPARAPRRRYLYRTFTIRRGHQNFVFIVGFSSVDGGGRMTMREQHKASDYRAMAAMCLEVASQMSLDSERTRLNDVAQKWLDLAKTSEAEAIPRADTSLSQVGIAERLR
jgi:hypothetical protein